MKRATREAACPRRTLKWLALGCAALVVAILAVVNTWMFASLTPFPMQTPAIVPEIGSHSAATCGQCHGEITAEWRRSRMASTWKSSTFQTEFVGHDQFHWCLNCHTPLAAQQERNTYGFWSFFPFRIPIQGPNPDFRPSLRDEGVTCVVCHLRDGALEGGVGGKLSPHPTRATSDVRDPQRCARCHQADPLPFSRLDRPIIDTVAEWENWRDPEADKRNCVDCHMPQVRRPLTPSTPERISHRHDFPGSRDRQALRRALDVSLRPLDAGGLALAVTNLTGHRFPTGEPARQLRIDLRISYDDTPVQHTVYRFERIIDPPARDVSDNTLLPNETRLLPIDLVSPAQGSGVARIQAVFRPIAHLEHASAAIHDAQPDIPFLDFSLPF